MNGVVRGGDESETEEALLFDAVISISSKLPLHQQWCDTMIAYSSDYRPQDDEDVWRRTFEVNDPDYFENPEPAVERYAEGDITHYGYPLGTKKVYYNNVHKHTIGLAYYNELASIPGW